MRVSMRSRFALASVAALLLACAGCGGPQPHFLVPQTMVTGADTIIVAHDNAFRLAPDHPVPTPFWAYDCPAEPTPENYRLGEWLGGYRVLVYPPGATQPIYGILSFCPVLAGATGPVTREYDVQIPQEKIDATSAGRISVFYEQSGVTRSYADDAEVDVPAWIIWLSERPFPQ